MGLFQDYMSAQIIAKNPALMQRYMADRDANRIAEQTSSVMGMPGREATEVPFEYPMMEGEQPQQGLMTIEPAQPATGLFAGASPEETKNLRFNKLALESGVPEFQQMAISNLQGQQQAALGPVNTVGAGRYIFEDDNGDQWWVGNVANKVTKQMETIYSPVDPRNEGKMPQGQLKMVDRTYGLTADDAIRHKAAIQAATDRAELETQNEVKFMLDYTGQTMAIEDAMFNIDTTMSFMNELAGVTDYSTVGFGKFLNAIPLSDANRWRELASTITGRLAMDKMMELKAASATGATGFGALSEKELKLLQDYYGNIAQSQDPKVIKANLEKIYKQLEYTRMRQRTKLTNNLEKYQRVHQKYQAGRPMPSYVQQQLRRPAGPPPVTPAPTAPAGGATPAGAVDWNDL